MKLVYTETGIEVVVGDDVVTKKGVEVRVDYFREPHKASSEGKVTVQHQKGSPREYFVSIIGAEWIEREDRGWKPAEKTITISSPLGDDTVIDKEGFIKQWEYYGKQFMKLNYEFYLSIKDQIENIAAKEFDDLHKRQNHKRESESKESRDGDV